MVVFAPFLAVEKEISHPEVLVVMAGDPVGRLPAAARRFHQGGIPQILLTNDGVLGRWAQNHQRNLYQVEWAACALADLGVPEAAVVALPFSRSGTIHDVRAVKEFVEFHGIQRLLVVTSDYHTRRTMWTFEKVFRSSPVEIGIAGAESAWRGEGGGWQGLAEYRKLTREFAKYLYYRLRY